MSVKCANVNHPDYKRLEKLVPNTIAVSKVWNHLDGNVSNVLAGDGTFIAAGGGGGI